MKIFSTAGLLCFCLFLLSCQKDEDNNEPTKTEMISSSAWVHESSGVDIGRDGTVDYSLEFIGVPTCRLDNILTFKADGTATAAEGATKCNASDAESTNFKWSFASNETVLNISDNVFPQLNGSFKIATLNNTSFRLTRDTVITAPVTLNATIVVNLKH